MLKFCSWFWHIKPIFRVVFEGDNKAKSCHPPIPKPGITMIAALLLSSADIGWYCLATSNENRKQNDLLATTVTERQSKYSVLRAKAKKAATSDARARAC